jgi:hypothetical protein
MFSSWWGNAGVSTASETRHVILVDWHESAGETTSYGSAGLIGCASAFPSVFPYDLLHILLCAESFLRGGDVQLAEQVMVDVRKIVDEQGRANWGW